MNRTIEQGAGEIGSTTEEFITKQEVARRLKKTIRTIENWQARGSIPFIKVHRSVLFKWRDVEAHLQQNFGCVGKIKNQKLKSSDVKSSDVKC